MAGLKTAAKRTRTVPGLEKHFLSAFNARRGDFLGAPVFAPFAFGGQTTDPWGPKGGMHSYAVPKQISFDGGFDEQKTDLGHFLKTTEEYDKTFSIDVQAEGSYGAFSASASSSYFNHQRLFTEHDRAYTMDFLVASVYTARRTGSRIPLDTDFEAALAALPATLAEPDAGSAYNDFFEEYGTHYLVQAPFGGYVMMTSSVDKSVLATSSETKIAASITAAFDGLVAKGSLTVSTAETSMDSKTREEVSIEGDLHRVGGVASDDKSEWEASLYGGPEPLIGLPARAAIARPVFAALTRLVTDPRRRQTMIDALATYLPSSAEAPVVRSTPVALNTVARATTDGLIVAYVDSSPSGANGNADLRVLAGPTQNSAKFRAGASAQFADPGNGDVMVRYGAVTAPIRKDEYYLANQTGPAGDAALVVLGDRSSTLGEPVTGAPASGTAATDGLLLVNLATVGDGPRGSAFGSVDGQRVAACSVHVWGDSGRTCKQASFCMPVRKGQAYEAQAVATTDPIDMQVTWVPLAGITFSAAMQPVIPGTTYPATDAGIVFGFMHCDNGPRGSIVVCAGDDDKSMPVRQAASAHVYWGDDTHIPDAGVSVPISKGEHYRVEQHWSWGEPQAQFFWIPIQDAPA